MDSAKNVRTRTPSEQRRIAGAVTAQLRQDFEPALKNIQHSVETLLKEVSRQQAGEDKKADLSKILAAVTALRKLIDQSEQASAAGDPQAIERELRHDIRNHLGGIKLAGEFLAEEFAEDGAPQIAATLETMAAQADRLLIQLDRVIQYFLEQPVADSPEAELARSVIESIAPRQTDDGDSRAAHAGSTLLIVDDNELNQLVLRHELEREGYRVESAASGIAALQRLELIGSDDWPLIDLILLDLLMPDMNGYEVLQRLKRDSSYRDIPVIMISGWDDLQSIVRCIEHGAEDYLVKPFEPTLLHARIDSALNKRRLRQLEQVMEQREIEQAKQIQRSLMSPPAPDGSPIDGRNQPAHHVSGDFFEHFRRADGIIPFALGDVSGKGFDAALLMAKVAGLFRYLSKTGNNCGELLTTLNEEFYDRAGSGRFVTAVVGFYDPQQARITFANAGHVPPLLIAPDGAVQTFPASAPPLGVLARARYTVEQVRLDQGQAFYTFSDGFIECQRPDGGQLDMEGFIPILQKARGLSLKQQLDSVFRHISAPGWKVQDDLTILAIVPAGGRHCDDQNPNRHTQ
jgi:sigma-B regulation protein RsbU (phosphoserine phosphatase)